VCVSRHILIVHKDIIKEHKDKMSQIEFKHLIYHILKSDRSINESKRHHLKFIVSFMCFKSHFGNMMCFYEC
jgi:hypothetical protein